MALEFYTKVVANFCKLVDKCLEVNVGYFESILWSQQKGNILRLYSYIHFWICIAGFWVTNKYNLSVVTNDPVSFIFCIYNELLHFSGFTIHNRKYIIILVTSWISKLRLNPIAYLDIRKLTTYGFILQDYEVNSFFKFWIEVICWSILKKIITDSLTTWARTEDRSEKTTPKKMPRANIHEVCRFYSTINLKIWPTELW